MEPEWSDLVKQLRTRFQEKYQSTPDRDTFYDARDVQRLLEGDWRWPKTFLTHEKKDIEKSLIMLDNSLRWRKSFGVNDLRADQFDAKLEKVWFWQGKDVKGRRILYFDVGQYVKGDAETAKRFNAFLLEKGQREQPEGPDNEMIAVFDMHNAGLGNLDYEVVKFLISAFEKYYPDFCGLLIAYEMPWILNAAWKVISMWMSQASRDSIAFVGKRDVGKYIDAENQLEHMRSQPISSDKPASK